MIRLKNKKWGFFQGTMSKDNGEAFIYDYGDKFIRYDWTHGSREFETIQEAMAGKRNTEIVTTLFEGT